MAVQLNPGDVLTLDDFSKSVVHVDPITGHRTVVSNNASDPSAPFNGSFRGLTMDRFANVYMAARDGETTSIYQVDVATGARRIVSGGSGGGVGSGAPLESINGLTTDSFGNLYAAENGRNAIWRINPITGHRKIISGGRDPLNDVGDGPVITPNGLTVSGGTILTVNVNGPDGFVVAVNPVNGDRTLVMGKSTVFDEEGNFEHVTRGDSLSSGASGISAYTNNSFLVVQSAGFAPGTVSGNVMAVIDRNSGEHDPSRLVNFPSFSAPNDVAVNGAGRIYAVAAGGLDRGVYDISPANDPWIATPVSASFKGVGSGFAPYRPVFMAMTPGAPSESEIQEIAIVWETDVLHSYTKILGKVIRAPGSLGALEGKSPEFKEAVRANVESIFRSAGVNRVRVINSDERVNDAANLYTLAPNQVEGIDGNAWTGTDRYNSQKFGAADVFAQINSESELAKITLANTIAHEAGHLLGLRHINPDGGLPVMDYDTISGIEAFTNAPHRIVEPPVSGGFPSLVTHNPVYHMKRYVDGLSHEQLLEDGFVPGSWDLDTTVFGPLDLEFNFRLSDQTPGSTVLYDVKILGMDADPSIAEVIEQFDMITLDELAARSFQVTEGEQISVVASSSPGVVADIIMGSADPELTDAYAVLPQEGLVDAMLFIQSSNDPSGFESFVEVGVTGSMVVPEPSAVLLLASFSVLSVRRRERG